MNTSTIPGYNVVTIELDQANGLTAAFTNGNGLWDNNFTKDYAISTGVSTVEGNTVKSGQPFVDTVAPTVPANFEYTEVQGTAVTLIWSASTDNVGVRGYLIYRNGAYLNVTTSTNFTDRTAAPNTSYVYTIRAYDAANNRSDLTTGLTVRTATSNWVKVYYRVTTGTVANIHYRPTGGAWTTLPGVPMTNSSYSGFRVITLNIGTATGIEAAFNNGSGTWDNNLTKNYLIPMGTSTLNNRVITKGEPVADSIAPSIPTNLSTTNVTQTSLTVNWNVSTDNIAVTGYNVYRNGTYVATVSTNSYQFTGLTAGSTHNITVLAFDAMQNRSAQSTSLSVTTSN
jgi:chitodextrinase